MSVEMYCNIRCDYNLNIFYESKKVSVSGNRFSNSERINTEQVRNVNSLLPM